MKELHYNCYLSYSASTPNENYYNNSKFIVPECIVTYRYHHPGRN